MNKTKLREIATVVSDKFQKVEDFFYQIFDLPYNSVISQRNIYLHTKDTITTSVFIEESIIRLSNRKAELRIERMNSNLYQYQNEYDILILIFRARPDLIIKYFDKPEFNVRSMKELLSEYKTTTKDFSCQNITYKTIQNNKSIDTENVNSNANAFKKSQSNSEILKRLEEYIKNPVNRIGKQQLARICYFAIESGLIKPLDMTHDEIVKACNTALSLEGKLELKKSGIYINPLDENGRRSKRMNKVNVTKLIQVFEEIEWQNGLYLVNEIINK